MESFQFWPTILILIWMYYKSSWPSPCHLLRCYAHDWNGKDFTNLIWTTPRTHTKIWLSSETSLKDRYNVFCIASALIVTKATTAHRESQFLSLCACTSCFRFENRENGQGECSVNKYLPHSQKYFPCEDTLTEERPQVITSDHDH